MDSIKDSFEIQPTKDPSENRFLIHILLFILLFLSYSFICWSVGYYMAKHKFKNPIIINIPEEKNYSVLKSR